MAYDSQGVLKVRAETEIFWIADYSGCALVISNTGMLFFSMG
jgi:hypothetical protein